MPRKPRMCLPGVPCRIIQRGNDREATFFTPLKLLFIWPTRAIFPQISGDAASNS